MAVIKKIELIDSLEMNSYDIKVTHYDKTEAVCTNSYNSTDENYEGGYGPNLAEQLFSVLKGEQDDSLLLVHLNAAPRGSLHSMIAHQTLKIPNSIEFVDNRTPR